MSNLVRKNDNAVKCIIKIVKFPLLQYFENKNAYILQQSRISLYDHLLQEHT